MLDRTRLLVPEAGAVDSQLAYHASLFNVPIAQDEVGHGRGRDELHEDIRCPVRLGYAFEEARDGAPIGVVPSAFALGLEDVLLGQFGIEGLLSGFEPFLRSVHGVDVGKGLPELGCRGRVILDELAQHGRCGCRSGSGKNLLHLLRPCELREDCGTLDGGGSLQVVAGIPCLLVGVVARTVASAEVDCGYFVDFGRVAGEAIKQLALGCIGNCGLSQNLVKGKSEDWDGRFGLGDLVLEMALVEDIALPWLDEEDDAFGVAKLRVGIGTVRCLDSCG